MIIGAVLLIGGAAMARPGMMPGGMNGRGAMNLERVLPMLHNLDLTDDQMEQVHEIMDNARERMESIRDAEDADSMRERFRDLFTSSSLTAAEVENFLNQRLDNMEAINSIIAETVVDIHDVLTGEQLQIMAEFEPGHGDTHQGRPGEHAPMMRGGSRPGIHSMR